MCEFYVLSSELCESKFNGLLRLWNIIIVYRCVGNTKAQLNYMIVTQGLVDNSILNLHLEI